MLWNNKSSIHRNIQIEEENKFETKECLVGNMKTKNAIDISTWYRQEIMKCCV